MRLEGLIQACFETGDTVYAVCISDPGIRIGIPSGQSAIEVCVDSGLGGHRFRGLCANDYYKKWTIEKPSPEVRKLIADLEEQYP